jgi:hypothetical protein
MGILFNSSLNPIVVLFILFSICQIIDGRFTWNMGSYCDDYCSRIKYKLLPVGICSCHRIASKYRPLRSLDVKSMLHIKNVHQFVKEH